MCDIPTITDRAIVGIGNTLAGDDGAGIAVIDELEKKMPENKQLFFRITGDIYSIADILDRSSRFIIVDAYPGDIAGKVLSLDPRYSGVQPSLHLTDISVVMKQFEFLKMVDPFPAWEIRGITVRLPLTLGEGLSPEVKKGVDHCVDQIIKEFFSE